LKGLFWQSAKSTKIKMMLSVFNKNEMTNTVAKDVMNSLGLAGFNKMMLIYSQREIVRALRVVADERNHPLMIHCASGCSSLPSLLVCL
jgi:protein tyrosine/serine phosphatase